MPSARCLDNIKKEQPPRNIPCTTPYCVKIMEHSAEVCHQSGLPVDTPIIAYDPDLYGPGKAGFCYCCCYCFAADTPIEAAPGDFALIQDLNSGDLVLAAGADLNWKPSRIDVRSGDVEPVDYPNIFMLRFRCPGDPDPRSIFVTSDHLFLTPDRRLVAVQNLAPNDQLLAADGQVAGVIFVAPGHLITRIQSITMDGAFDGANLDGHLLNANGLVTADYKVQVYYESERLEPKLLAPSRNGKTPAMAQSAEYQEFLASPEAWPKGFDPILRPLINVPLTARSFLTKDQAEELHRSSDVGFLGTTGAQLVLSTFQYVRATGGDEVTYIFDPYNELPNAYAFMRERQRFVVVTGGLARVDGLYWEGMSLIAAAMRSYLREGIACVGESDYNAVAEE
ncbi:MAG: hypothetical protein WCE44_11450, partial [Candidatus Velthaea sp.]